MENSRPGTEDTDNAKNKRSSLDAEGAAAWLAHRRVERYNPDVEDDDDEEETAGGKKKAEKARVVAAKLAGSLPLVVGEEKHKVPSSEQTENPEGKIHFPPEDQAAGAHPENAEDWAKWEQEMAAYMVEQQNAPHIAATEATPSALVSEAAENQDEDEKVSTQPGIPSRPRISARPPSGSSLRGKGAGYGGAPSTPPPIARGGYGGSVPPYNPNMSFGTASPEGPDGPTGGGGMNTYFGPPGPNIVPPPKDPNVLPANAQPNKLEDHEHPHRHRGLALLTAGLVVEHILGKRSDKKIDKEMRRRTDSLREQIEHNQASQAYTQQKFEAWQQRMVTEHNQQRRFIEHASAITPEKNMPGPKGVQEERVPVMDTDKYTEALARSGVVMEQVAAAAEKDIPVERVYERRQEIRDEPSSPAGAAAGGAASVGTILAGSPHNQTYTSAKGPQSTSSQHDPAAQAPTDHYRSAALTGAGVAAGVIVLGLIAYLIFG